MKKPFHFILLILIACFISACDHSERQKASGEKINGDAQETTDKLTNNSDTEKQGNKGEVRSTKEDVIDIITGK